MQFIKDGPEIPNALLQAHEEGKVVFFCGAGISYKVGLGDFKWLADDIFEKCYAKDASYYRKEEGLMDGGLYDQALESLERRLPAPIRMREALWDKLQPKLCGEKATETHEALLTLARNKSNDQFGALHLVTTNFDRTFEIVGEKNEFYHNTFSAPMFPVPKQSKWDGLVYLHGLLPEKRDNGAVLNNLVVTSGDFGRAYISERWASRFVSELFRLYQVCFVGYSLSDPVMRYMTDAVAADRLKGETTQPVYAFVSCKRTHKRDVSYDWESRGINPIVYNDDNEHRLLHETIKNWSKNYAESLGGKKDIIIKYAGRDPRESSEQDNFAGRVAWAVSDSSGIVAKRFAELNPAPPIEWLDVFLDERYGVIESLGSSLPIHAPLNDVSRNLCFWILRYMNDPELALRLARLGGHINEWFLELIKKRFLRIAELERNENLEEIEKLRKDSPYAFPDHLMKSVWSVFLAGRLKCSIKSSNIDLCKWMKRLVNEGLTLSVRFELRELLSPKVIFGEPIYPYGEAKGEKRIDNLKHILNWELALTADNVNYFSSKSLKCRSLEKWKLFCPDLLEDLQSSLLDALILMRELGGACELEDRSLWDLPSVSRHEQNERVLYRDWAALVWFLRDSWLAIREKKPDRASRIAYEWFDQPYPTFKRLALYCAAQDGCVPSDQWVDWLLADDGYWLWSSISRRETMRLLVSQGDHMTLSSKERLEMAILDGPSGEFYEAPQRPMIVDRSIWLRLTKLRESGASLGTKANSYLDCLVKKHSDFALMEDEHDEFAFWRRKPTLISEDDEPVFPLSRDRHKLVSQLKEIGDSDPLFFRDDWDVVCRDCFDEALDALDDLGKEDIWDVSRWRVALDVWREKDLISKTSEKITDFIKNMPDGGLINLASEIALWLEVVVQSDLIPEKDILFVIDKVLRVFGNNRDRAFDEKVARYDSCLSDEDLVCNAINRPIGRVCEILIKIFCRGDGLSNDGKTFFSRLCDTSVRSFSHGRVLLASNVASFFYLDESWTSSYILPLFNWQEDQPEAKGAWQGFFRCPRFDLSLIAALKSDFLETIDHYDALESSRYMFVTFFTISALRIKEFPDNLFSVADFSVGISLLPQEGREGILIFILSYIEGKGDSRAELWKTIIEPFWCSIWPKEKRFMSERISEYLAQICCETGEEFPRALTTVWDWLIPVENPDIVAFKLKNNGICSSFPVDSLRLLYKLFGDTSWPSDELKKCLVEIERKDSRLGQDDQYKKLIHCLGRS